MSFPQSRYRRKWQPGRVVKDLEDFEKLCGEGRLFIPKWGSWAGKPISGAWLQSAPYFIFLPRVEKGCFQVAVPAKDYYHFGDPLGNLRSMLFELAFPGDSGKPGEDEPWTGRPESDPVDLAREAFSRIKKLCPRPWDFPVEDYLVEEESL